MTTPSQLTVTVTDTDTDEGMGRVESRGSSPGGRGAGQVKRGEEFGEDGNGGGGPLSGRRLSSTASGREAGNLDPGTLGWDGTVSVSVSRTTYLRTAGGEARPPPPVRTHLGAAANSLAMPGASRTRKRRSVTRGNEQGRAMGGERCRRGRVESGSGDVGEA